MRDIQEKKFKEAVSAGLKVRDHAYAPYSHFKVGAVVVSKNTEKLYTGCNVENASYGATVCAERNAIFQAAAEEGKPELSYMIVTSGVEQPVPPCALCLQVIAEFCPPSFPIYLVNTRGRIERTTLQELLPHPFNTVPEA
ncbi:MAG: cytidine deaminase [Spirochaetales bacterium]|nr:cytidine deaminase [Spirochaetales bacterium]